MEFFDINDPEIKGRLVAENTLAFAIVTNIPIVPGHVLICTKRHVSKINDLTGDEIDALLDLQKKLKNAMIKSFGAEGFNYAWNEGEAAGHRVPHIHIHMLPAKNQIQEFSNMSQGSFYTGRVLAPTPRNKSSQKLQS